jgi:hypothetical protein
MKKVIGWMLLAPICVITFVESAAQTGRINPANLVYADATGVLRYTANQQEAAFFGVNYTTPFAFAYRAQKALGVNLETAIQNDVYHMARLGFNAFRVHVWDTEIADTAGNLLQNEHLRLFDFLLAELKKRNIKTIITPIAFWGNGYPEKDENTPGFSRLFGRGKLTTNDTAIRAQENYLRQFFKHVNPYTRQSYEADKDIIAVELNNEPAHSGPQQSVTNYINRLAAAVKSTGWSKPVFYNISQGPSYARAVANSVVDGFSFQWYPSGLVGNQTLQGNALPNVDVYRIPFRDTIPAFKNKALMVYEFDPADIMESCMYPAIARSFRGAGFQWATQFAYDPMAIAQVNTEYQTHYLNLAYTPSKAISMLIAGEAFRLLPRLKSFGAYPADTLFDGFRVSHAEALSEMNTDTKFYHSNPTRTQPIDPKALWHVAGVGSSPLVDYEGTGAYFLDKIAPGIWRLEVMPDVVYIRDAFERASPQKPVTAIQWAGHSITVDLPDLGAGFTLKPLNSGAAATTASGNMATVTPGTYLLTRSGKQADKLPETVGAIGLGEFVAPPPTIALAPVLRHIPQSEVSANTPFQLHALWAGPDSANLSAQFTKLGGGLYRTLPFEKKGSAYTASVPAEMATPGLLQYRIMVQQSGQTITFPGAVAGNPFGWDYYQNDTYATAVAQPGAALQLYNPAIDKSIHVLPNFRRGFQTAYTTGLTTGALWYKQSLAKPAAAEVMGFQVFVGQKLQQRLAESAAFDSIVITAKAEGAGNLVLKLALVDDNGQAFSTLVTLSNDMQAHALPLSRFAPDSALLLPRPYPDFQPVFFTSGANLPLQLARVEKLQLSTSAAWQPSAATALGFAVEGVTLKK